MRSDLFVVVRDAVDLFVDKNPQGEQYKTQVQDVLDDGTILVGFPSYMGKAMPIKKGQKMAMSFYRESGMYTVDVKVARFVDRNGLKLAALVMTSKPVREQRRNYFRLTVSLKAQICTCPEEVLEGKTLKKGPAHEDEVLEITRTNNISISGISLKTRRVYATGEKYMLKVYLNWPRETAPPLVLFGEVKRVGEVATDETYNIGFQYFGNDETTVEHIAKYILTQQQKQIKQRRLIEGK